VGENLYFAAGRTVIPRGGIPPKANQEGEEKIEKSWLQYLPKIKQMIPEDVDLPRHVTLDEAGEIALEFHARPVDFYRKMADLAGAPPGIREVFAELAKQQEHRFAPCRMSSTSKTS
jgi:hypothetical protein